MSRSEASDSSKDGSIQVSSTQFNTDSLVIGGFFYLRIRLLILPKMVKMIIFKSKRNFLSENSRFAVQNGGTYLPQITRETCMLMRRCSEPSFIVEPLFLCLFSPSHGSIIQRFPLKLRQTFESWSRSYQNFITASFLFLLWLRLSIGVKIKKKKDFYNGMAL